MELQTRVFILCCNRLLRESIARIVNKKKDFEAVVWQPTAAVFPLGLEESNPGVMVCDSMQLVEDVRVGHEKPSPKLVMVAMDDSPEIFLTAVRQGALGYVLKDASAAEVVSAIRAVSAGEAVCPARFTKLLFETVAGQPVESETVRHSERPKLTRREQELIPLIGRGLTNKEIANQLNLSEQTIKSHVHRLLRKVRAEDRQSLTEMVAT
jgi:DNA-binding NarL/FixJ family response regulator